MQEAIAVTVLLMQLPCQAAAVANGGAESEWNQSLRDRVVLPATTMKGTGHPESGLRV